MLGTRIWIWDTAGYIWDEVILSPDHEWAVHWFDPWNLLVWLFISSESSGVAVQAEILNPSSASWRCVSLICWTNPSAFWEHRSEEWLMCKNVHSESEVFSSLQWERILCRFKSSSVLYLCSLFKKMSTRLLISLLMIAAVRIAESQTVLLVWKRTCQLWPPSLLCINISY